MLGRRFLLLVAVLMGLTALAASVAPRDSALRGPQPERRDPTPTPTPVEPEAEPDSRVATRTIVRTISADAAPRRLVVKQGDVLQLEVASSELDTVRLMGRIEPVEPLANARFHILADRPDKYPIELLESERRIGTVEVRAASEALVAGPRS
jgi:hypothetical protein